MSATASFFSASSFGLTVAGSVVTGAVVFWGPAARPTATHETMTSARTVFVVVMCSSARAPALARPQALLLRGRPAAGCGGGAAVVDAVEQELERPVRLR